jgi:hypothetical protein
MIVAEYCYLLLCIQINILLVTVKLGEFIMAKKGGNSNSVLTNINDLNEGDYTAWLKTAKRLHGIQQNMAWSETIEVSVDSPKNRKFDWIYINGEKVKRYRD